MQARRGHVLHESGALHGLSLPVPRPGPGHLSEEQGQRVHRYRVYREYTVPRTGPHHLPEEPGQRVQSDLPEKQGHRVHRYKQNVRQEMLNTKNFKGMKEMDYIFKSLTNISMN